MTQALNAWMNGELVGTWSVDREAHAFRYTPDWLASSRRRSLSQFIPSSSSLETKGKVVKNYFDNLLLPDNEKIRLRLSARFKSRLPIVAAQLPGDFPERTWLAISQGMNEAAERFLMEAGELKPD